MEIYTWQAREEKGLSLEDLAALSGISKTTLNYIENGKISPRLVQLEKIAAALGVKMSDLYDSEYK